MVSIDRKRGAQTSLRLLTALYSLDSQKHPLTTGTCQQVGPLYTCMPL